MDLNDELSTFRENPVHACLRYPTMTPDYARLIDAETWAFIDRTNAFYPPEAVDWPIERNREVYDRMARAFHAGRPPGIAVETTAIETPTHMIPIRIYAAERCDDRATILYFHGGGFVLGSLDSHDDVCAELCAATGLTVVSIDYRLAPEHTGTAALEDAIAAYGWVAAGLGRPVLLAGDSAGGNLAACLAHHAGAEGHRPLGQVLIYPLLGAEFDKGSYLTHARAPLLTTQDVVAYRDMRSGGTDRSADPRFTPLAAARFGHLPPTFVFTAQCDPLSSDGETYCSRLRAEGVEAFWHEEEGLPHSFLRARNMAPRARAAMERITRALVTLAGGARA